MTSIRCLSLLAALVAAAGAASCQFDPNLPKGHILCTGNGDCPRGYTCETVVQAAWDGTRVCCSEKGCSQSIRGPDLERVNGKVAMINGRDAGSGGPPADGPRADAPGGSDAR